jgi:hypothetical protein
MPYPRVRAALDAHDLGFVLAHGDRIRLGLAVAVEVLELFAQQAPERLEAYASDGCNGMPSRRAGNS